MDNRTTPQAILRIEAELARLAAENAPRLRNLRLPKEARAFGRALARMSALRQEMVLQLNEFRFAGAQGLDRPAAIGTPSPALSRALVLNALDARARRLTQVIAGLHAMRTWRQQPLFAPERKPDLPSEQLAVLDRVVLALHRVVNPAGQDAGASDLGCFADIPLPASMFLAEAHAARRVGMAQGRAAMRFIDIGCGGGVKVMLAAEIFDQALGLEYDPGYVAAARRARSQMGQPEDRVFQADALAYAGYGDFDVIYFYRPMQDDAAMIRLEQRIVTMARPGTILIAPYPLFAARAADWGCGHVAGAVYVTATTAAEAAALHDKAETTGITLPRPGATEADHDYLAPMITAARNFGFAL